MKRLMLSVLLMLLLKSFASASYQAPEILIYKGKSY